MSDVQGMFEALSAAAGRASQGPLAGLESVQADGEGSSEDGTVFARVSGGKLAELRIDAHTMRRGNAEVADLVIVAVNAAIEAHAAAMMAALSSSRTDFGRLQGELAAIGEQAQRTMEQHLETMRQMVDQATKRAES